MAAPDAQNLCCVWLKSLSAEPRVRLLGETSWPSGAQYAGNAFNLSHVKRDAYLALAVLLHGHTRQRSQCPAPCRRIRHEATTPMWGDEAVATRNACEPRGLHRAPVWRFGVVTLVPREPKPARERGTQIHARRDRMRGKDNRERFTLSTVATTTYAAAPGGHGHGWPP
jgi:hypothetical protein